MNNMLPKKVADKACFVIFMDLTNPKGTDDTKKIFDDLKNNLKQDTVKIIVGNKMDVPKERAISEI